MQPAEPQVREPILVFDIGGTKIAGAVWLPSGTAWGRSEIPTQPATGPEAIAGRIVALGRSVLDAHAKAGGAPVRRVGVASAGQFDTATGNVTYATFHLPGWIGFPLGARLAAGLGLPVIIDNDVNCHALAEARLGAGRAYRNFVLVAVGTGIGGGVVIDRQVYRGRGGGAGEIGQLRVDTTAAARPCSGDLAGCLEVYAATSVMVQESGYPSAQALAKAYLAGADVPAVTAGANWLGQGLAQIAYVLAPDAFLIGGSAALLGDRYLAGVQASLAEHVLASHRHIPLHFAALGADSGLAGAALLAAEANLAD